MYKHILVPIDGSDTSRRGLREAITLAGELHSSLRLPHVVTDFTFFVEMANMADFEPVRQGLRQHGHELLETGAAEVRAAGIVVSTMLSVPTDGRVADAIIAEAASARCDLIVIGTHGRRGFQRALMGSDAELVLRSSPVPVLLVRAAGAAS